MPSDRARDCTLVGRGAAGGNLRPLEDSTPPPGVQSCGAVDLLLALLDGSTYASAIMCWGKPGPIRLPYDPSARRRLVEDHATGARATVEYAKTDSPERRETVSPLVLSGLCPTTDRLCRWVAIDLDAADHGSGGLLDPAHAARCIAERADAVGLLNGLLVASSRGGKGRHVWLVLPAPTPLIHAVVGLAYLIAAAYETAKADATTGSPHAFRTANGKVAKPGQAGAVELIPHSTWPPDRGWPLTLPMAGAFAETGGGVIVDPFTDQPVQLSTVPSCDAGAWRQVVTQAEQEHRRAQPQQKRRPRRRPPSRTGDALDRINPWTRAFLDGQVEKGNRNQALFAAVCNLVGVGVDPRHAEGLALAGALGCGLPEREAIATIRSALKRKRVTT